MELQLIYNEMHKSEVYSLLIFAMFFLHIYPNQTIENYHTTRLPHVPPEELLPLKLIFKFFTIFKIYTF